MMNGRSTLVATQNFTPDAPQEFIRESSAEALVEALRLFKSGITPVVPELSELTRIYGDSEDVVAFHNHMKEVQRHVQRFVMVRQQRKQRP